MALAGCVAGAFLACSTPPDPVDTSFSRESLFRERLESARTDDRWPEVINLVSGGYERGLLDSGEVNLWLERAVEAFTEQRDVARATDDYERALQLTENLIVLSRDPLSTGFSPSPSAASASGNSPDDMLLRWAQWHLERDEPVLALHRILRRSTLGDLDAETMLQYREIAAQLNHDEAYARLTRIAVQRGEITESAGDVAVDSPATMLAGTVTVWVNRGIQIRQGVGIPDRVVGSGFFIDPRGYLITNHHVIASEVDPTYEGFSRLYVKLPGRPDERVPARVIGYDRVFDLALLKVEIDPGYVFSLSDTKALEPGERVLALGSPGGLDSTITSGIVSAAGRRFLQMGEVVQMDVPINPGNSGGPLILPDGQVAGIVFAGLEQFEGVNFAIPSYWVRHFLPRLYQDGEVTHPWMGVSLHATRNGLEVVYVAAGSPAAMAGISVGDRLLSLNGVSVESIPDAQDVVLARAPGALVATVWEPYQNEAQAATTVADTTRRLIALAPRPYSPVEVALEREPIERLFPVLFGMDVDTVSSAPWGPDFVITDVIPGSIADESSLSIDDPFALRMWRVDDDLRAAFIEIIIKRRKAGFVETGVQLGAFLETNSFL